MFHDVIAGQRGERAPYLRAIAGKYLAQRLLAELGSSPELLVCDGVENMLDDLLFG